MDITVGAGEENMGEITGVGGEKKMLKKRLDIYEEVRYNIDRL